MFVDVAVPLPLFQTFTYAVPSGGKDLQLGCRVLVPFGPRHLIGVAVQCHDQPRNGVKSIRRVLDERPLLPRTLLELAKWISSYYLAPPGEVLRVMLPPGLLARKVSLKKNFTSDAFWPTKRRLAVTALRSEGDGLTEKQKQALELLRKHRLPVLVQSFLRKSDCSRSVLRSLASKGIVEMKMIELHRSPWLQPVAENAVRRHPLNADQQRVFDKIHNWLKRDQFHSTLIHGVTGSGKTEIYLNAITQTLKLGRSALLLVPEIGLTPQMSRQFRAWFGKEVAILHSALSDGERFDQWRKIRAGQARVVIGTRSAVFAPLENTGIIIVDEEQDGSYKQEDLPRYHARDVALKRGELENALVLLGSATPQLETYFRSVRQGKPEYETLTSRILERPLPEVRIVDMRVEFQKHGKASVISTQLADAIQKRLKRDEQILILLNRRGYASALLCRSCGNTEKCDNCSISLTYHQDSKRLLCHYCGLMRSVPDQCKICRKEYIHFLGAGTEKIQEILARRFPEAKIDRLDRDTVQRKGSVEKILGNLASGWTDMLVGTQMIAKGHDFPRVTLVGVLNAEQSLRMADFRAAEKTFQLLTQVAGRAGRGEQPGEVIIQTYYPNHYSLKGACAQDYRLFFDEEIRFRRSFQYPPFTALAHVLVQGKQRTQVERRGERVADLLRHYRKKHSVDRDLRILGPAPAPLERLKGRYRVQILIKTANRRAMHQVLDSTLEELRRQKVSLKQISIDIDPLTLL